MVWIWQVEEILFMTGNSFACCGFASETQTWVGIYMFLKASGYQTRDNYTVSMFWKLVAFDVGSSVWTLGSTVIFDTGFKFLKNFRLARFMMLIMFE